MIISGLSVVGQTPIVETRDSGDCNTTMRSTNVRSENSEGLQEIPQYTQSRSIPTKAKMEIRISSGILQPLNILVNEFCHLGRSLCFMLEFRIAHSTCVFITNIHSKYNSGYL